jgi:hypothetical protein
LQADKLLEEPAVKAAFKALADDENLDILAYIEKVDASAGGTSDMAQDGDQTRDQNSDDTSENSSTADTAKDSLDTKIKKLGLTEKLPEAFKEAYLSAKQKQLDAECEEIMKDKEVLEVIKGLETDPVSPEATLVWATVSSDSMNRILKSASKCILCVCVCVWLRHAGFRGRKNQRGQRFREEAHDTGTRWRVAATWTGATTGHGRWYAPWYDGRRWYAAWYDGRRWWSTYTATRHAWQRWRP